MRAPSRQHRRRVAHSQQQQQQQQQPHPRSIRSVAATDGENDGQKSQSSSEATWSRTSTLSALSPASVLITTGSLSTFRRDYRVANNLFYPEQRMGAFSSGARAGCVSRHGGTLATSWPPHSAINRRCYSLITKLRRVPLVRGADQPRSVISFVVTVARENRFCINSEQQLRRRYTSAAAIISVIERRRPRLDTTQSPTGLIRPPATR